MTNGIPTYDHEVLVGEGHPFGEKLPDEAIVTKTSETHVLIKLIDETPCPSLHAERSQLENHDGWDSMDELRNDIDWSAYEQ